MHIDFFLDYLKKYVGEALSEGMARVVAQQPADAVDFLGRFLVNYANVKEKELLVRNVYACFVKFYIDNDYVFACLERMLI